MSRRVFESRSKIVSLAASARAGSRSRPGVGEREGRRVGGRRGERSTSRSPIGSPAAQVASLSTSLASACRSSPTMWTSAAHASGSARTPRCGEPLRDPALELLLRDGVLEDVAGLRARLPERRRLLHVLAHEREHRCRRGARRGTPTRRRRRPPSSRPSAGCPSRAARRRPRRSTSRASPKRLPALQSATAASAGVSSALRISVASGAKCPRRRASARLDLGAVAAREEVDRLGRPLAVRGSSATAQG